MTQSESAPAILQNLPPTEVCDSVSQHISGLLESHKPLAVAVSGGADSVALLLWLLSYSPQMKDQLSVMHFNHATRGARSDEDEAFVKDLCNKLGVRCVTKKRAKISEGDLSESALREARFAFIKPAMIEIGATTLFTGHHLSDRVETLLMRISRGSGLKGLIAPQPLQKFRDGTFIARPLIKFSKQKIVSALKSAGQDWREDASNQENTPYRNYIRNILLPGWRQRCSQDLEHALENTINQLEEDSIALEKWAENICKDIDLRKREFPLDNIRNTPRAVQQRVILSWLNQQKVTEEISFQKIREVLDLQGGESVNLNPKHRLSRVKKDCLKLENLVSDNEDFLGKQFVFKNTGSLFFPNGKKLSVEIIQSTPQLIASVQAGKDDPSQQVHLSLHTPEDELRITFRSPGLSYQPLGMSGTKSVQDAMMDRKLPSIERNRLPTVLNSKGELLWIPGLIPAEVGRVKTGMKWLLRLTYIAS